MATTDRSAMTQSQDKKTGNIKQTTAWAKQEHQKKKEEQYSLPQRVEAQGNGALGVESPLFYRTLGKTCRLPVDGAIVLLCASI